MFLLLSILSCKQEDKKKEESLKNEAITAKWLVSGSNTEVKKSVKQGLFKR